MDLIRFKKLDSAGTLTPLAWEELISAGPAQNNVLYV